MNIGEYYITTLTAAVYKIGPILLFAIGAYFIFVKLPFLFLKNSLSEQKKKLEDEQDKGLVASNKKDYSIEDYNRFVRQMKQINEKPQEKESPQLKLGSSQSQAKQEKKTENKSKQESKKEEPKAAQKPTQEASPESVFNFKTGERFSKEELKKRYHDLLRQNHPDRVASMGADFKKLAEQNTKDINKAYEKLKSKAS